MPGKKMKRIFCNLLVLVLLMGMLPLTADAGGGSWAIWSENFETDGALESWTIVDANNDGFGFRNGMTVEEDMSLNACVISGQSLREETGTQEASDDYLISPAIDLTESYNEYELSFDMWTLKAEGAPQYTFLRTYVIDADKSLTVWSLQSMQTPHYASEAPHESEGWRRVRYDLSAFAGKKIRLAFRQEDSTANCLRLDNFELTEHEPDSHVERICILNVPEPEVGLGVPDMDESSILVRDAANLSLVPGSVEYLKTIKESPVPQTGAFEEGAEYAIRFRLKAEEGAFTYADAIASVNGRRAIATLDDKGTPDDSDDIITIFYDCGYLHSPKQPLDVLPISLTPPVAGKKPSYNVQTGIDAFSLTSIYWCEVNADLLDGPVVNPEDHFESGKKYRCYFELKPDDGFCFTENTQATANGKSVPRHYGGTSDGGAWFIAEYEAVENDYCTIRFCTDAGDTPESVSGSIGERITLPALPDQPERKFFGWGYEPDGGSEARISDSFLITGSCTLYAVWLDIIEAPEVAISTEGVHMPATNSKALVDIYADYSCVELAEGETVAWWLKQSQVGIVSQRYKGWLDEETTYYGMAVIQVDKYHYFADDAADKLVFSGAELDEALVAGMQMRLKFHMTIPRMKTYEKVELNVPTQIPGYPVNSSTVIPIYSLTPGVKAIGLTGVWDDPDLVGHTGRYYEGYMRPGKTFFEMARLRLDSLSSFDEKVEISIQGAKIIYQTFDGDDLLVYYSITIMTTYGFTAVPLSTNGTYPCGYFRSSFEPGWTTIFDFAFVPGGEHWIKAMAEPGYTFVEWRTGDGKTIISADNPYFFTLDNDDWNIRAVFEPAASVYTVRFVNAHGEDPETQTVPEGEFAKEPKGLTADDYTFMGWFTDPACGDTDKYDFSEPVTGNLILYSGWKYSPGMSTDKTELNKAIADAEKIETFHYTDETVAAFQQALADAKEVQADPAVSQDTVNGVLDDLNNAVFGLKLKPDEFLFEDVKDPAKFYYDPVYWAYYADPQITKGIDDTHFGPDDPCTRGQVVTFLWRAAGCPEPVSTATPFKDLKADGFYVKAVAWAVENEITNGITPAKFGPDGKCTRGKIVTFLWRFKGKPAPMSTATSFKDLKADGFYLEAVAWAVENGITNGLSADKFGPDETCTRGQVVTFLYRATKN